MSAPINVAGQIGDRSRQRSPRRIARTAPPFLRRWRYRHGLGGDFALGFVDDSPLEEDGFEPSVPLRGDLETRGVLDKPG